MSETTTESTAENTTTTVEYTGPVANILPVADPEAPVKRQRGRPKGSKNKPKPEGYVAKPRKPRTPKAGGAIAVAPRGTSLPTPPKPVVPAAAFVAPADDIVEAEPEEAAE